MAFVLAPLFLGPLTSFTTRRNPSVSPPSPQSRHQRPTCCLPSSQSTSLRDGTWFKLICGASSHDAPRIRNLSLVYAALSVDAIDCAADGAIVAAVRAGITAASLLSNTLLPRPFASPWIMVSVNDDTDPHFRKATFPPSSCPPACPRPCETVCPAAAIDIHGVIADVCYGCGRCIPVCPDALITAVAHQHTPASVCALLATVDAVEIHTTPPSAALGALWAGVGAAAARCTLVAVSFPNAGSDAVLREYLRTVSGVLASLPEDVEVIWQADGRPMSGDIGRGAARASVILGGRVQRILEEDGIRGYVQLAGGTNDASARLMAEAGLLRAPRVGGIAVGGYARKIVGGVLDELQSRGVERLEDEADLLAEAMAIAGKLVDGMKGGD